MHQFEDDEILSDEESDQLTTHRTRHHYTSQPELSSRETTAVHRPLRNDFITIDMSTSETNTNEKHLSRLTTKFYKEEYKAILDTITLPSSFYKREGAWAFSAWVVLEIVTSYYLTGLVEEVRDEAIKDPYQQLYFTITSMILLALANGLLANVTFHLKTVEAKTKIAIKQGAIIDDTQAAAHVHVDTPAAFDTRHPALRVLSRVGYHCSRPFSLLHHKVEPYLHPARDIALIFTPNALLAVGANVAFCRRMGELVPFMKSPWFFWPEAILAGLCYGRLTMVLHGSNADEGAHEHGSFLQAFWNLIAGRAMREVEVQPGVWQRKSNKAIILSYYICWGILFHELFEGKFDGTTFTKNLFEGLIETFPEQEAALKVAAASAPVAVFGWMVGLLEAVFEGFTEAYNGQKHTNFLKGLTLFPAAILLLASTVHSIPTILGIKEPLDIILGKDHDEDNMMPHQADLAYGIFTMTLGAIILMPPSIAGFAAMVLESTLAICVNMNDTFKNKLVAPVASFCCFSPARPRENTDTAGATNLRERTNETIYLLAPISMGRRY